MALGCPHSLSSSSFTIASGRHKPGRATRATDPRHEAPVKTTERGACSQSRRAGGANVARRHGRKISPDEIGA